MVYAKSVNEKEWKKHLTAFICVFIASLIMSINIKSFVRAGHLIPGGFTGLSLLLQRVALEFMNIDIPYSIINISLNAIPAFIGFKMIGKKFTSYSVIMIVLNSFLVDIIPVTPITYDPLLVSVFGGILNGLAIVIALYGKASSGGTDFIAIYLSNKLHQPSWNFVFAINVVILIMASALFGFEAAMYSIIFQFVSTQVIERFHRRDQKRTLFMITSVPENIEKKLMEYTHHGITRFEGKGCYLKEDKTLLYTVVGADEVKEVIHFVRQEDPQIFINVMKSDSITGKFYQEPIE
ncbi:MAG: YitT family protein [Erysipelotrichales bacterium]|nr:YitT family protein [Erysipelotrichales bacterium]